MNKLNFSSPAAVIAAFKAGAKFRVHTRHNEHDVTGICAGGLHGLQVSTTAGPWDYFLADGSNSAAPTARLILVAAAPAPTQDPVVPQEPFDMKTFIHGGRVAINPKTGEEVLGITFSPDGIDVDLRDPATGAVRVSKHYRHDGTHKFQANRSLVFKPLPPKTRKVRLEVLKSPTGRLAARLLGLNSPRELQAGQPVGKVVVGMGVTVFAEDIEVTI